MKVLITGASSGIGRDMAKYLYSMGYDLFLVSRDKSKLDNIFKDYKNVVTIGLDLSIRDNCIKLYDRLKNENIDILVNNAGFGDVSLFCESSLEKELKMIDLNVSAYHILTKLFLKDFVKRDSGRILNVASIAGFMPGPYMATYYATKNYVVNLSLSIYEELRQNKSNVKISVFCPGGVKTNFDNVANVKSNVMQLESEYAARYAINKMFLNKLIIIPSNMWFSKFFSKFGPIRLILYVNYKIQKRKLLDKS